MSIAIDTIYGVSLGFEYVPDMSSVDPLVKSMMAIDLFVIRIMFINHA